MIDQEILLNTCHYNPSTGVFKRVMKRSWMGNWYACDSVPKSITGYGYLQMNFEGRPYVVHRLIFLYVTGEFPKEDVDHINGDRLDNRFENLRLVSRQDNLRNQGLRNDNTSGHMGVSHDKSRGLFHAYIGVGKGKRRSLGYHSTVEKAVEVRSLAEKELEYHNNHGKRESWSR